MRKAISAIAFSVVVLTAAASGGDFHSETADRSGRIAFVAEDGKGLFVVNPDGTGVQRLAPKRGTYTSVCCPAWSPNGRLLAYSYFTDNFRGNGIFAVAADGGSQRRLTRAAGYYDTGSSWAPDSRRLAFDRNLDAHHSVWVVSLDGGRVQPLLRSRAFDNLSAVWSPEGEQIAFYGRHGIWLVAADGGNTHRITGSRLDEFPVWSRDGQRIAFIRTGLWIMDADGTHQRSIARNPAGRDIGHHAWSPDDRKLVFMLGDGDQEIFVVHANGSGLRNLTNNNKIQDACPAWSPDGKTISFVSDRNGTTEIFVMDAMGRNVRSTGRMTDYDCPVWSTAR